MPTGDRTLSKKRADTASRRAFARLMAGGSLALAAALIAGCGGNLQADPKRPRPKTHITGRGGANGK